MIRACRPDEIVEIAAVINDAAQAYRGLLPETFRRDPYLSLDELERECAAGVRFWGFEEGGKLLGVMGLQDVGDVTLIRHAYVRTLRRRKGIGGRLLAALREKTPRPLLIGTWRAATWAIRFYERHGFEPLPPEESEPLLRKYWTVPDDQIRASIVLAEPPWIEGRRRGRRGAPLGAA